MTMIRIRKVTAMMQPMREKRMQIIPRLAVKVGAISVRSRLLRVGEMLDRGCEISRIIYIACIFRRIIDLRAVDKKTNIIGGIICAGKPLKKFADPNPDMTRLSSILKETTMLVVRLSTVCKSGRGG
jgi:hypothetical protein